MSCDESAAAQVWFSDRTLKGMEKMTGRGTRQRKPEASHRTENSRSESKGCREERNSEETELMCLDPRGRRQQHIQDNTPYVLPQ